MFAALDQPVARMKVVAAGRASRRPRFGERTQAFFNLLTTPLIYSLAVPLVLLDVWVSLYEAICFRVYGIERVRRRRYFVIDRHELGYLNPIEKANCLYCSYATGLLGYVREVAARTEQYWCPIKHARPIAAPHRRYARFAGYGDAVGYRQGLLRMRQALRPARADQRRRR